MKYLLIQFTQGWDFQAYQEISEDGQTVNIRDLDGNLIATPSSNIMPYPFPICNILIDDNPPTPSWAQ